MIEIKGIYAASVSILNDDMSLNIEKTSNHCEKIIKDGCHGVIIFGSTGQAQLISLAEKIQMVTYLSKNKKIDNFIIGCGLNSLLDTINLMKISINLGFKKFLVMPPAYYKYGDKEVINYYTKLIHSVPESKIILYNFEKLCGYKFSIDCVTKLVEKFPNQIVGVKDSSYNLFEKLKFENFSIFPGSELKLLKGLKLGCSGIITATCNVTAEISRKVYDDFLAGKEQLHNQKLCDVRTAFDNYNLISGLHTICSLDNEIYRNILPPLSLLNKDDEKNLINNLKDLNFKTKPSLAA